ncbi:hypothetical protein DE146DRAFT_682374 [Phaeosphaeria sp. MPI-PUGE-AT-0046c]|nr:hypothetical protein DE146DRAFT_682374 [Phaeosphaeria sp. MPI-PUGE-AT-0046c]
MSSAAASARIRKACSPCIRAKAKCSPSEQRSNGCQRCMRLNKDCTYEVTAKKPGPGPKSRSRNIDDGSTQKIDTTTQAVTPDSSTPADTAPHSSPNPDLHRLWIEAANFRALDPVEAGLIDEHHAYKLVRKFQESFIWSFPFVVVDTDGPTLRQQEPFLFHAILTVTAINTPSIQHDLSEKFRHEIGRVVEYARKSLGILQGLLVYGGWYHGFYHPASQQLSTVVQLCVAMVQDLGLPNSIKRRPGKLAVADCSMLNRPKGSLSEKRAFLGTCFLTMVFNHAWRKRTTLSYSRSLKQCCAAFEASSVPSDILISPLIKAKDLLSRVNDHFSYSDLDNADLKGDVILEMSTTSFLVELDQIRESIASNQTLQRNRTWSAWFYTYIVICKLVFLDENERLGNTNVDDIPGEINNLLPHPLVPDNPVSGDANDPKQNFQAIDYSKPGWNALAVTNQYGLNEISERFTEKLQCTLAAGAAPWKKPREDRDSLYPIACLHNVMFHGYQKRLQRYRIAAGQTDCSTESQSTALPTATLHGHHSIDQWQSSQITPRVLPFVSFMNFDSINFDGLAMPSSAFPMQGSEDMLGDWVWNIAMDDFTMPSL